jgi:protein-tyrosine phosphatase
VTPARQLDWDGCRNVRDLGGLEAAGGRRTRWGAVVRADDPGRLTAAGWSALRAHGIRTIVDLRNDDERPATAVPGPAGLAGVHLPLDDAADTEFWRFCWDHGLDGTPLYYRPFLERKPERCAAAVAAVARARPGGVLVHCGIGRDRTGLVALLLLALVGVAPGEIAADYELSSERLRALRGVAAGHRQRWSPEDALARHGTSARAAILAVLASVDVEAHLRGAGLRDDDLVALRARLLDA